MMARTMMGLMKTNYPVESCFQDWTPEDYSEISSVQGSPLIQCPSRHLKSCCHDPTGDQHTPSDRIL